MIHSSLAKALCELGSLEVRPYHGNSQCLGLRSLLRVTRDVSLISERPPERRRSLLRKAAGAQIVLF